jgi:hypothetical protein
MDDIITKAKELNNNKKYQESFDLCEAYLIKNASEKIQDLRDYNIKHLKDSCLVYPEKIIKNIKVNNTKNVAFSMTTCKRFDLFEKTINSFLNCCLDLHKIDKWFIIDDNSANDDRLKMKERYPFIELICKNEFEKGHYRSMNIILNLTQDFKYLLHLEDDFHFILKRNYITESIEILEEAQIQQVLFNKNYTEIEPYLMKVNGGIEHITKKSKYRYIIHEYCNNDTFIKKYGDCLNNAYWPHFSFRPSLIKRDVLTDIGLFYNTDNFEYEYAKEYTEKGYKSGFLDTFSCIHIGKKTWESIDNAYTKNKEQQFNKNVSVYVINSDINNWKYFKKKAISHLDSWKRVNLKNISITPHIMAMFLNNDFNYQQDIINKFMTHKELWENKDEYTFVLSDTYNFKNFNLLNTLKDDVLFFNDESYRVSLSAKQKLIDVLYSQGTRNEVYSFIKNIYNINTDIKILFDDYLFFSQLDSPGNDICHKPNLNLNQLKEECENNNECVGFNTLGWMKKVISPEFKLVPLFGSKDGLYVKVDRWKNRVHNIPQFEGYTFYPMRDSYGSDITHVKGDLETIKKYCDVNGVAFNTYGYVKYKINNLFELNTENLTDGLYIKTNTNLNRLDNIIDKLNKRTRSNNSNISFTVTTCKRWNIFERTMDIFLLQCQDVDLIQEWILIDDNSSEEDRTKMKERYPFFTFIFKKESEKGHAKSMNMLLNFVKTDYVIHFEDDWSCNISFNLSSLFNYMKNEKVDHLILRHIGGQHDKNTEIDGKMIYNYTYNSLHYLKPELNKEYDMNQIVDIFDVNEKKECEFDKNRYWWWPGFTLNPSIFNMRKLKDNIGYFNENIRQELFEYDYAIRAFNKGYIVNYVDLYIEHTGHVSSYKLNDMKRYYD